MTPALVDPYEISCARTNDGCWCQGLLPCGHTKAYQCESCKECFECKHKLIASLPKPQWRCRNGRRVFPRPKEIIYRP